MNGRGEVQFTGLAAVWVLAFVGLVAARVPDQRPLGRPKEFPKPASYSPDAVARAFKDLETTVSHRGYINEPPGPTKSYLPYDYYCEAIDFLIRTKLPVDDELLRLARSGKALRVRYRAARILAGRGNVAVVPVLERMCASKDDKERYLVWRVYEDAVREKKLPAPKDVSRQLELYAAETDGEVRERIEGLLGTARAKGAVQALINRVKKSHDSERQAVWALGMIGDKSAVPVIIDSFSKESNHCDHLQALGRIATPEAVDFIIANLDTYGAVEALFESRSPKALPALRRHLKKLKQGNGLDKDLDLAKTRIAILRLEQKNSRAALLALAEDRKEGQRVRHDALHVLLEYDAAPFVGRISNLYRSEKDNDIRYTCLRLLKDSQLEEITEAMMDHLLSIKDGGVHTMIEAASLNDLHLELNKRLGTSFRDVDELCRHVRTLRKVKPPTR